MQTNDTKAADLNEALASLAAAAAQRERRLATDIRQLHEAAEAIVAVTREMANLQDAELERAHSELHEAYAEIQARMAAVDRHLQHQQTWFDLSRPICNVAAGARLLAGRQVREPVDELFVRAVAAAADLSLKQDEKGNWWLGPVRLMAKRDGETTLDTVPLAILVALVECAEGKRPTWQDTQTWFDTQVAELLGGELT